MQIEPKLDEIIDCLYRVAAKALIIRDNKLLMVYELDDEWWGVPGGGIVHGESIAQALKREIEEELGVPQSEVESSWDIALASIGAVSSNIPRVNLYCKVNVPMDQLKKTNHIIDYKWVGADELPGLILSPAVKNVLPKITQMLR